MYNDFDRRVRNAEGRKKIFDNRVKYILFLLAIITAGITIWDKYSSWSRKPQIVTEQKRADSLAYQTKNRPHTEVASLSHKRRHPKTDAPATSSSGNPDSKGIQIPKDETPLAYNPPKVASPIQVANSDNIEFKLLSAEGSRQAQSIKMTVILTTTAANWHIWSDVHSIIDSEGNEYKLRSFTNGASSYDPHVALNTNVPIKLTYTFGGVLPKVKLIKLFKFEYQHKSLDDPIAVEFRDILIEWK